MFNFKAHHLRGIPCKFQQDWTLEKYSKLSAVNTKSPCYRPVIWKKLEQKWREIGMSGLASLKVRVAYLQCGQSSP